LVAAAALDLLLSLAAFATDVSVTLAFEVAFAWSAELDWGGLSTVAVVVVGGEEAGDGEAGSGSTVGCEGGSAVG